MNRGVEIDPAGADSDAALLSDQVRAGLVVRMAVLYDLLTVAPIAVRSMRRWRDALLRHGRSDSWCWKGAVVADQGSTRPCESPVTPRVISAIQPNDRLEARESRRPSSIRRALAARPVGGRGDPALRDGGRRRGGTA